MGPSITTNQRAGFVHDHTHMHLYLLQVPEIYQAQKSVKPLWFICSLV